MILAGSNVRILPPFDEAFPGTYEVREVEGTTAHLNGLPEGASNAFDFTYLEVV